MTTEQEVNDFLAHHGIKGMKWGVRKRTPAQKQRRKASKERKKLEKYGDRKVGLTIQQRDNRRERTVNRVHVGILVAVGAVYVSRLIALRGQGSASKIRPPGGPTKKSVTDLIDAERKTKVDAIIKTHKEGFIDKQQMDKFVKSMNDRYDRKIVDAIAEGVSKL